jgi:hypothetical protein
MRKFLLVALVASASACGTPGFTSAMRPGFDSDVQLEARCFSSGRDGEELDAKVREMYRQGYRLVYVSEYTSSARLGYPSTICFERPAQQRP